ncbi:radical SAM protein [candidate division KSB1 bacterium]|nr:radical SAM protein [candidate division KSB1 bacterium]
MSLKKKVSLAAKNPKLAWHKARVTLFNSVLARFDYSFRNGRARAPKVVSVRLTNLCNMRCKMCGQPKVGDEGVSHDFFTDQLSLKEWQHFIDQIAPFRPNFYLWGGEPLIYGPIFDLVKYAKSKGLLVQMNTNGLLLDKFAHDIVNSGLDDLIISIDGPAHIHDKIRGIDGAFEKIKKGVIKIAEIRTQTKGHPVIRIRGTIFPDNFEHLSQLVEITKEFGADSLNFNHLWFTSEQYGKLYEKIMLDEFSIQAGSWKGFVYQPQDLQLEALKTEIKTMQKSRASFPITVSPAVPLKQLKNYYQNLNYTCGIKSCYSIYFKTYLLPNGDVYPCPDFPDFIAGNIRSQNIMDIWNGPHYRHFRTRLKTKGLLPICSRCCDLFVSSVGFY